MQTPTLFLLALAALTTTVYGQSRCQMFIFAQPDPDVITEGIDVGEIRQDCAVASVDPLAEVGNSPECKTLGTFEVSFDADQIIGGGVTGLPEDVTVRIFNENLREGFVKYKAADLNFENPDQCLVQTSDDEVQSVRCEFDCP